MYKPTSLTLASQMKHGVREETRIKTSVTRSNWMYYSGVLLVGI